MISGAATLLALAISTTSTSTDALSPREVELYQAGVRLEARAQRAESRVVELESRLAARTPTVAAAIAPCPEIAVDAASWPVWLAISVAAILGGVALGRAL